MERLSLSQWTPPWIRHEHVARYRWACELTKGCRVLEAACGTGYGSLMLVEQGEAAKVDAFDISPEALDEASRRNGHHGTLRFAQGDAMRLPVPDHSYDLYISFETIEHLTDDQAYLLEARRVLAQGGAFVCSTPNRDVIRPGTGLGDRPLNPFHLREYSFEEFRHLLEGCFAQIEWYGQNFVRPDYLKRLTALGRRTSWLAARCHQAGKAIGSLQRREESYTPRSLDGGAAEILIALCRS